MSYAYAYLFGDCLLGIVWLAFFLLRKDLRHQQLFVSFFTAPFGFMQVFWFYGDYWRPEYAWTFLIRGIPFGIEEILFAFFIGGIGSVIYEVIFRKRYRPNGKKRMRSAVSIIVASAATFLLLHTFGWNSIWASTTALALASIVMVVVDRDLRRDCIASSVLMFATIFCGYLLWLTLFPGSIARFWVADALSGIALVGVPIEELCWFISWAMFSGIAYEFSVNAGAYTPYVQKRIRVER